MNVDSHVLSQDVDMHAPPILFKNQDTNDIPITSGTYVHTQNSFAQNHFIPPIRNSVHVRPIAPFTVDIQSVNLGISHEDTNDSNISIEENDENIRSQAPSIHEPIVDQHKEDDFENEQGEVIQESNAVPQLISSDQSMFDQNSFNRIPDYTKSTTKITDKNPKISYTQTEANNLWDKYPATTESYAVSSTSEKTTPNQTPFTTYSTLNRDNFSLNNRAPTYLIDHLNLPHIQPSMVNDMYASIAGLGNRNNQSIPKPKPNAINESNIPIWNQNVKNQQYFGVYQPAIDQRPPKFTNIAHHGSLLSVPAMFNDNYASRPHQSRRPISPNQKPFSRFPIHFINPTIPTTNYSVHNIDHSLKPNWHAGKPFDANIFRPNVFFTTTKYPASTTEDQTPQTSDIVNSLSTQKPFTKNVVDSDSDAKVQYYTENTTNVSRPAASTQSTYDLSRGKPFVFNKQIQQSNVQSTSILNIGEEKRPIIPTVHTKPILNETKTNSDVAHESTDIFDYKESNNPHNYASITENTLTTEYASEITNSDYMMFGQKNKVPDIYPKTPATEMQPPPTYTPKYKNYVRSNPSVVTYPNLNVRVEEVMGLNPPPIPRLPVKIHKQPEIQSNYGKISHHHMHQVFLLLFIFSNYRDIYVFVHSFSIRHHHILYHYQQDTQIHQILVHIT